MSNKPEIEGLKESAESAKVKMAEMTPTVHVPEGMLTPAAQAATNALVTEAVKSVFAQLGPLLSSMALTEEKMLNMEKMRRAKSPDEVKRELRERQLMQQDMEEAARQKVANQSACPHTYPSGQQTFHVCRNYPDRQPRFTCPLCFIWVTPREWRIGAPDAENPRGKAYIAPEHPLYKEASKILATKANTRSAYVQLSR